MSISVSVSGIKNALNFLDKKESNVVSKSKEGLTKAAIFLQGEVKSSIAGQRSEHVSVDTGRFLNSVDFAVGKEDAMVFSSLDYAKFLEWGTSKFTGRRHFNNSKDRNRGKVKDIMQAEIDSI